MGVKPKLWIPALLFFALAPAIHAQRAADWPQWRGPNRDGAIASFTAPATWPEQLTQRWKVEVGTGYATPLVVGDRIYMFSRQGENEVMSALDPATGRTLWQTAYPVTFEMQRAAAPHGPGPKSTPIFFNGKLYAIGMTGVVTALDATTGRQLWQKPGSTTNIPRFTTHAFSPLVDRGMVIFHVGGNEGGALTAYDLNTGDVKWSWTGDGPSYGSPMAAELGGTRQIVTTTQTKIVGVDAANGALLWERPYPSPSVTNAYTPIVYGQNVIVSGNGGPLIAFTVARRNNQWVTEDVWQNEDGPSRLSNAVLAGDMIFGLTTKNSGQYFGVDARTGRTLWLGEPRQAVNAVVSSAGNVFFVLEDDGELIVVRSSTTAFEPLRRYKVAETATWTPPVVSGNRIFVKDLTTLALWTLN